MTKLETINSDTIFSNPWWNYKLDRYYYPNGMTGEYHYVDSRGSSMIISKTDDDKFLMVKQYRYPNKKDSIEFPGGGAKFAKTFEDSAKEELLEETGYYPGSMTLIGEFNPYNGVTNEFCMVYYAEFLVYKGAQPDITEEFDVLELTEKEITNLINDGEIWDGMTLASWSLFKFKNF